MGREGMGIVVGAIVLLTACARADVSGETPPKRGQFPWVLHPAAFDLGGYRVEGRFPTAWHQWSSVDLRLRWFDVAHFWRQLEDGADEVSDDLDLEDLEYQREEFRMFSDWVDTEDDHCGCEVVLRIAAWPCRTADCEHVGSLSLPLRPRVWIRRWTQPRACKCPGRRASVVVFHVQPERDEVVSCQANYRCDLQPELLERMRTVCESLRIRQRRVPNR